MIQGYKIKEHSWLARIAAHKLGSEKVAIVIGETIYLYNISITDFLKNTRWLNHELCHIEQFRKFGLLPFIIKYLWESVQHGYYNNKFEIEARNAEMIN